MEISDELEELVVTLEGDPIHNLHKALHGYGHVHPPYERLLIPTILNIAGRDPKCSCWPDRYFYHSVFQPLEGKMAGYLYEKNRLRGRLRGHIHIICILTNYVTLTCAPAAMC